MEKIRLFQQKNGRVDSETERGAVYKNRWHPRHSFQGISWRSMKKPPLFSWHPAKGRLRWVFFGRSWLKVLVFVLLSTTNQTNDTNGWKSSSPIRIFGCVVHCASIVLCFKSDQT